MEADPWKHRSLGMRCRTCCWFVEKEPMKPQELVGYRLTSDGAERVPPKQTAVGRCRRHAPTISGYPVVFETDWCGDHRLDENNR